MIETERLRLRPWRREDAAEFARVTNTPAVMAYLGGVRPLASFAERAEECIANERLHGFSFWLAEEKANGTLLGFCGLEPVTASGTPIENDVEIGWRLREDAWGKGYASEAARACVQWAWDRTALTRIVAMTVPENRPSRRVMERIGMTHRPDFDFGHPLFAPGHPLYEHVTYTVDRW